MAERRGNNGLRKVCDCGREKWAKCKDHPWHFNYKRERFSVDVQAGRAVRLKGEAEGLAREWRDQIDNGTFVRRERGGLVVTQRKALAASSAFTLDDFAVKYLAEYSNLKQAGKVKKDKHCPDFYVFQPMLAFVLPDGRRLGSVPFAQVEETMYELYVASRRADDYASSTVNKDVTLITAMCRWAARPNRKLFGPLGDNPISGESRILVRKPPAQRQRPITDAELNAIKAVADRMLWAFIELALITCLRLTELYRLLWKDVRVLERTIRIRAGATKVDSAKRFVPLDDRAIAILEWLRIDPAGRQYPEDAYVFGECGGKPVEINDRFNTAVLKAFPVQNEQGEPVPVEWSNGTHGAAARARLDEIDLVFSDLRHEGALRKYRRGWRLNEIQTLLGHMSLTQTSTYLGVGHEEVQRAMREYGSGAKVESVDDGCNPQLQSVCNPTHNHDAPDGDKLTIKH